MQSAVFAEVLAWGPFHFGLEALVAVPDITN